jgi:hypothetical protein
MYMPVTAGYNSPETFLVTSPHRSECHEVVQNYTLSNKVSFWEHEKSYMTNIR